jgi:hypothetical protein
MMRVLEFIVALVMVAILYLVAGVLIWLFAPGSASGKSLDSGV